MHHSKLMSCLVTGLVCGWSGWIAAEEPAKADVKVDIVELQVQPASLELKGGDDSRRVLISGKTADGRIIELKAGSLFYVPPDPHDSWVIGNQRYVSLHFLGAERYAT